ncbi:MAG: hypothetical protein ACR2OR_01995 [Hyphomicrobiales bacterium]
MIGRAAQKVEFSKSRAICAAWPEIYPAPFAFLILFAISATAFSQQGNPPTDALTKNPGDLTNILIEDEAVKEALITPSPLDPILEPWERFKRELQEQVGLKVGIAHTSAYQNANTNFAGQCDAAGGILAILGDWQLWGEGTGYSGRLAFRFQDRHNLSSGPANLQTFGILAGSLWPAAVAYSEFNFSLLELWWEQSLIQDSAGFRVGKIIPFAVHDYSFLKNPTTSFMNAPFSLNATIPYTLVGLGAAGVVRPVPEIYVVGGIYDANGRAETSGFNTFFNQKEYLKMVDIGFDPGYINPETSL